MKHISKEHVILIHDLCIKETGGSYGFRDEGMLDSALAAPFQSFGGQDLYETIEEKAARLAFCLINDHAFIDGNKRTGTVTMLAFLSLNGIELDHTQDELSDIILDIASGSKNYEELYIWIQDHKI